ncbi:MAG: hypothetical protein V3T72_03785 [Thermoanaerobaculia bacterium]
MNSHLLIVVAALTVLAFPILGDSEANTVDLPTPADISPPVDEEPAQDLPISDLTDPVWMTGSCSASYDCGDGNTISCTGHNLCRITLVGFLHVVECDGNKTFCPNSCTVQEQCYCGGTLTCGSDVGDCQQGNDWVKCDGTRFDCPNFCL